MGIDIVRGLNVYMQRWLNAYSYSQRTFRRDWIASGIV